MPFASQEESENKEEEEDLQEQREEKQKKGKGRNLYHPQLTRPSGSTLVIIPIY